MFRSSFWTSRLICSSISAASLFAALCWSTNRKRERKMSSRRGSYILSRRCEVGSTTHPLLLQLLLRPRLNPLLPVVLELRDRPQLTRDVLGSLLDLLLDVVDLRDDVVLGRILCKEIVERGRPWSQRRVDLIVSRREENKRKADSPPSRSAPSAGSHSYRSWSEATGYP